MHEWSGGPSPRPIDWERWFWIWLPIVIIGFVLYSFWVFKEEMEIIESSEVDMPLPARGQPMPHNKEQWARMADLYEKALLREKEENSRLRAENNQLRQKLEAAKKRAGEG